MSLQIKEINKTKAHLYAQQDMVGKLIKGKDMEIEELKDQLKMF